MPNFAASCLACDPPPLVNRHLRMSRKTPASGPCSLLELQTFLGQSGRVLPRYSLLIRTSRPCLCAKVSLSLRAKEETSMARKVGQIISRGDRRWLIRKLKIMCIA